MAGIPIHTKDPISPASSVIRTQTAYSSTAENPSKQANNDVFPSYPAAQPGVAPTPTSTTPRSASQGPSAPQPGAAPVPPPPTITAQPSLPPPPRVGEKPLSPEHYTPVYSTPAKGVPAASTTSTSTRSSFDHSTQLGIVSSSPDMPIGASLEHPPGYVQNPFASDMTPDQRFAVEQEQENRSETLPSLGYTDSKKGSRSGLEEDDTVWGAAKKWAKETGEQASKLGEEVWDKFGPDK